MTNDEAANMALLAVHLKTYNPEEPAPYCVTIAQKLARLGQEASRNAVNLSNIMDYQEKFDRKKEKIQEQADALLEGFPGLKAEVKGDPRGHVLKIHGLPGNTFGGVEAGFGV